MDPVLVVMQRKIQTGTFLCSLIILYPIRLRKLSEITFMTLNLKLVKPSRFSSIQKKTGIPGIIYRLIIIM